MVFSLKNPNISIYSLEGRNYIPFFYSSSDTKSKVLDCFTWLDFCAIYFGDEYMEKEMATHSSVLAWRIPGTGEPGGLPSMGSHRVGHD